MRKVVLQMHMTLDGFADGRRGFFLLTDRRYWKELDDAVAETGAADVDTLLMGKGAYLEFAGYWPKVLTDRTAPRHMRETAQRLTETRKIVISRTLRLVGWQRTTIVRGDVGREIARLKRLPGNNMLVPGGVAFPRALIERDLVDEYLLSVVPSILGEGRDRLFGPLERPRRLKHIRSWSFRNGVVLEQYIPVRSTRAPHRAIGVGRVTRGPGEGRWDYSTGPGAYETGRTGGPVRPG